MENLISMTDFVLGDEIECLDEGNFIRVIEYAKFLKQPLELWMFVPCDEYGNILKIIPFKDHEQGSNFEFLQHHYYDKAKDKCLFEGFRIEKYTLTNDIIGLGQALTLYSDIESLITDFESNDIKLTETAKNMFK